MKPQWLFILLLTIVCAAAGTHAQMAQGDKRKQDSIPQGKNYTIENGMQRWTERSHTQSDGNGIMHADPALAKSFSAVPERFRSRIDSLSRAPVTPLPFAIHERYPVYRLEGRYDGDATDIQNFVPDRSWTRTTIDHPYRFAARLVISPNFYTFIIKKELMAFGSDVPVEYYLTNVDTNGYFLSSVPIAEFLTPMQIVTAEVSADGLIHSHTLDQVWEKDPLEYGYENNRVKEQVSLSNKTYLITATGDIIPVKAK